MMNFQSFSEGITRNRFSSCTDTFMYQMIGIKLQRKNPGMILSDRCHTVYKPSRDICIDESPIPFKGEIYFRQFILSKRARFV